MATSSHDSMQKGEIWWVPDPTDVWTLATQNSTELPNGCVNFLVHRDNKLVAHQKEKCLQSLSSLNYPEDLVFLHDVNQATILACIRERYRQQKIYTSVGLVLLAVNPFKLIPGLYGNKIIEKYLDPKEKHLPAHVYIVPSRAYETMCRTGGSQSILISGESGAGKTEATKQCLSFLTFVAHQEDAAAATSSDGIATANISEVAARVIAASPILEAFGNALTLRNPNSSRFGKWMVLNFTPKNIIQSSNIVSYLLEKSRVTNRDPRERNYHIFYQILRGSDSAQLQSWNLTNDVDKYLYLAQQKDDQHSKAMLRQIDDPHTFQLTVSSFQKMGFSPEETTNIFRLISGVLHLGNVQFNSTQDDEASEVANPYVVDNVAQLFGVSPSVLAFSLCNRTIESGKGRTNVVNVQLNKQKAVETRDSLARNVYDKIFQAIIVHINVKSSKEDDRDSDRCIGLLDIFGFEIFDENSFEQLCINYCNEMLQHHFNFVVFTSEKNLYSRENITCETIDFRDNSGVMKEIEMMFKSLDEESRIPKGSSKTWYEKLKRGAKCAHIVFPNRRKQVVFQVKHYAGEVDYSPKGVMEKNVETINNDLVGAMLSSTDPLIQQAFATPSAGKNTVDITAPSPRTSFRAVGNDSSFRLSGGATNANMAAAAAAAQVAASTPTPNGRKGAHLLVNKSISWRFTHQLADLISMLNKTESHFIRCVKSNESCKPGDLESTLIHRQLLYSGVFEVVKIQQSGLPCRLPHYEFIELYRCLAPSRVRYTITSPIELIRTLTHHGFKLPNAQMGMSMTFFKTQEQRDLENAREALFFKSATKIQTRIRCRNYHRLYLELIVQHRAFVYYNSQLIYKPTEEAYERIQQLAEKYAQYKKYPVLLHLVQSSGKQLSMLQARVTLIEDASARLHNRTEAGVQSLEDIIARSIELEMTAHPVVADCKTTLQNYYKALEFVDLSHESARLNMMASSQLLDGIVALESFTDVLPDASATLHRMIEHKRNMDAELETIEKPLKAAFALAKMRYDATTGNLTLADSEGGKDAIQQVRSIVAQYHDGASFLCSDTRDLFEGCCCFLALIDEFVPDCDASGALEFIESRRCRECLNSSFQEQTNEFRKWADIQLSSVRLREQFSKDCVPCTALGEELEVKIDAMEEILNTLLALREPSRVIQEAIKAGSWILKLRKAYLANAWEELEQVVMEADRDGVENNAFDSYQECIEELNSCQWQVIYHGLMNDVLFVLGEPVFRSIPLHSEAWLELVKDLPENMTLVETVKTFAAEKESPELLKLVPVLETLLQLRSLMYQREIELSRTMQATFIEKNTAILSRYPELQQPLEAELKACADLIRKTELEDELDSAISNEPAAVYSFDGRNEQPYYRSICDLSQSVEDLSEVLADIDDLAHGRRYHDALQEKINLTKILHSARQNLTLAEDADSALALHAPNEAAAAERQASLDFTSGGGDSPIAAIAAPPAGGGGEEKHHLALGPLAGNPALSHWIDWEAVHADFEGAIEDNLIVSTTLPAYLEEEYRVIVGEMIRRALVQGFRSILGSPCVKGEVDISIHVSEDELSDQFHKYNILARMMGPHFDEFPENLKALSLFTTSVLRLRKHVLEDHWDPSIHALLDKIKTMDHGGGRPSSYDTTLTKDRSPAAMMALATLSTVSTASGARALLPPTPRMKPTAMLAATMMRSSSSASPKVSALGDISGLSEELTKVEQELAARESLLSLKKALEHVRIRVPDAVIDNMTEMVDLEPLKLACNGVRTSQGKHSKQLLALAESLISVLETLLAGDIAKIDQRQVDDCASHYVSYHLDSTSVEAVFKYIRVHTFLKNLCAALAHDGADRILRELNDLKDSLDPMPQRFIPWLKASYIYCELMQAFASEDWIQIVESTRKLEECIDVLSALKITTEGEGFNEGQFLDMLRARAISGYSTALRIKEEEENEHTLTVYQNMTADDVTKERLRKEDAVNPYGIKQLRKAGYDDNAILNVKFPVKYLWALDFDPILLRKKGFKAKKLIEGGYSVTALYYAGYTVEKLKASGVGIAELREAGVSVDRLKLAGFEDDDILKHGGTLPKDFLKNYGATRLVRLGMALPDLIKAGFSPLELRAAGFTALELKTAGLSDVHLLREAGFPLDALKSAFDISELKESGYTFTELQDSGVSDQYLFKAGFHLELEQQALLDLFHTTNGSLWKICLNWTSITQPLSRWYGVTVERDADFQERVVGLDLRDNHLVGTIPPRLALLTQLRTLKLGMNFLTGPVPSQLASLLRSNRTETDLNVEGAMNASASGSLSPFSMRRSPQNSSHLLLQSPTHTISMGSRTPIGTDFAVESTTATASTAAIGQRMLAQGGVRLFPPSSDMKTPAATASAAATPEELTAANAAGTQQSFYNYYDNFMFQSDAGEDRRIIDADDEEEEESLERTALMDLYYSTNGSKWRNKINWGSDKPIRTWTGVAVDKAGHVVKLNLASNNLQGPISKSIYMLDHLKELDLRLNQLLGPLPDTLGHMITLTHCYLHSNRLGGSLPESMSMLQALQVLDLRSNQFSGEIPVAFSRLQRLKYCGLNSNKFPPSTVDAVKRFLPYCKVVS